MTTDLSGLADMTRDETAALWRKAHDAGDKSEEYIIRDHYTQQFGGDPSDVMDDTPAAAVPEPAPDETASETVVPVQEPAAAEPAE